ncbi:FkbM family methyltransferase [Nocardiopsis ansamitocini]|uniref:Methyltransferase FkbM domain-containing protein n=1 Tax=Nocardiopsis ansamitocini TaxID=1670832 RepID=A0A9W6UH73_9ACTN|nr:FkbM family methyltransferase [Nocardiopsis ansamitocini]GLU46457.1 hypothetical protein Nans01_08080 [Nocardiopsis ansamitocini]
MPQSNESNDYRTGEVGRRRSWYGAKKHVKTLLGWRLPNLAMRGAVGVVAPQLRATGRLPAPAAIGEVTGKVADAEYVMLAPARCVIAKELYWGQGRRPQPADDLAVQVFAAAARKAGALLDVGAYTGLFTLVGTAVNPDLRAHAFELVPEVYRALFDNAVRNRVLHRVTLHHTGVGDPTAQVTMPAASGDSALPCFYSSELEFADGVPVRVVALDEFTDQVPHGSPVLMKVDVEGTETTVFEHGERFLAAHHPDILCEVLPDADCARLRALLEPYGYRFHLVGERALAPAGELAAHPRFRDWYFTTRTPAALAEIGIPVAAGADRVAGTSPVG